MSRLQPMFERVRREGRPAIIPYVTVGYPERDGTPGLVHELVEAGADAIELGIPFSDPIADGPTVQASSQRALELGVTAAFCLEVAEACRNAVDVPLLFMTYYNPVLHFGLERFCRASVEAGVDGLIVPDLPPDEGEELEAAAAPAGLDTIYLVAPTSTEERIAAVAARSKGFIYLVSLVGVTGARASLASGVPDLIARVRRQTTVPVCVGFGISTPEHVRALAGHADGVIFASRLLDILKGENGRAEAIEFVRSLRAAAEPART